MVLRVDHTPNIDYTKKWIVNDKDICTKVCTKEENKKETQTYLVKWYNVCLFN